MMTQQTTKGIVRTMMVMTIQCLIRSCIIYNLQSDLVSRLVMLAPAVSVYYAISCACYEFVAPVITEQLAPLSFLLVVDFSQHHIIPSIYLPT